MLTFLFFLFFIIEKAAALKASYPDLVEIGESNEYVVSNSDIVFIGLLPGVARSEMPLLPFNETHFVISMMAAINIDEIRTLTRLSDSRVCRTVPLPSAARRSGPILLHPVLKEAEDILNLGNNSILLMLTLFTY
jgi:pyrroline-5-carboxylate reductase